MKKILIVTAAAAIMATSIAAYANTNDNNITMANGQTQSNIISVDNTSASENQEKTGPIEYRKTVFEFADSGETIVTKMWMNPGTLENRVDKIVTTGDGKVAKNYSLFTKDGAKHHINFIRDESGKAISGEEFYYTQEVADTNADNLRKYETFAGLKAMYQDTSFWKDKGTVASNGKTLKKLLYGNEEEGTTTTVYIDESTGLPVKEEAFVNGKLFSTMTYEFKHVENDKNLFDVSEEGVEVEAKDLSQTLRPMQLKEEQNSN